MRKLVYQNDQSDCGPACIASILKYYNHPYDIETIRDITKCSNQGTNGIGIKKALEYYMFNVEVFKVESIKSIRKLPCITLIDNRVGAHYVVLLEITHDQIIYHDPEKGITKELLSDFLNKWHKIYFEITPKLKLENYTISKDKLSYFSLTKKGLLLLIAILILLTTLLNLSSNSYLKQLVDSHYLDNKLIIVYISITLIKITIDYLKNLIILKASIKLKGRILTEFIESILNTARYIFRKSESELLTRFKDVTVLQEYFLDVIELLFYLALQVFIIFYISLFDQLVCTLLVIGFIGGWLIMIPLSKRVRKLNQEIFMSNLNHTNSFLALIKNAQEIKKYNLKEYLYTKYRIKMIENLTVERKTKELYLRYSIIISAFLNLVNIIIILRLVKNLQSLNISYGKLILVFSLSSIFLSIFESIPQKLVNISNSKVSLRRVNELLNYQEQSKSKGVTSIKTISLKNVSFSYDYYNNIIDKLNAELSYGKINYIVGPNGSGKSTLLELILSTYYPDQGVITINDAETTELNDSYLGKIASISNDTPLLNETVKFNITLSSEVNEYRLDNIIKILDINRQLLDRLVINEGLNLSSGEKQKVLLARALYKEVDVILLDEPFIFLDQKSKEKLANFLRVECRNKIIVVVTHNEEFVCTNSKKIYLN